MAVVARVISGNCIDVTGAEGDMSIFIVFDFCFFIVYCQ